MNIAIEIFGILGALATIGLGIPQLIQQLKTLKVYPLFSKKQIIKKA